MNSEPFILVCDPDPAERGLLGRAFRRGSHQVRVASNARDTMRILAVAVPKVVVLADRRADSEVPSLISWIRTVSFVPTVPIVALVPHYNQNLTARCYEAGCDLVVSTPLDIDALLLALAALLRRPGIEAHHASVPTLPRRRTLIRR